MRLAQITNRAAELSEKYELPEHLDNASRKLSEVSGKVYDRMSVAGEAARRQAIAAYRTALEHPKTSIGGIVLAAALVGGLLWYMFGDERRPVQRRRRRHDPPPCHRSDGQRAIAARFRPGAGQPGQGPAQDLGQAESPAQSRPARALSL